MVLLLVAGLAGVFGTYPSGVNQAHALTRDVANYSFDAESMAGVIPGWTETYGTSGFSVVNDEFYSLQASLKLEDNSTVNAAGLESDKIKAIAGEVYKAKVRVKLQSGSVGIYMRFWDASQTRIGNYNQFITSPTGTWTELEITGVAPANTETVSVLLYSSTGGTATAYFDDVVLEAMVANSGFEEGSGFPGWTQTHGSGGVTVTNEKVNSGAASLKIVDNSLTSAFGVESGKLYVSPGETYTATAMAYFSESVVIYLRYYDANGQYISSTGKTFHSPTLEWTRIGVSGTVPANAAAVKVLLYLPVGSTGTAYFDDVKVEKTFLNLGPQMKGIQLQASEFGVDSSGNKKLYSVQMGSPINAKLSVIDAVYGNTELLHLLPGATGAWAIVQASDGIVYAGSFTNGHLYKLDPGGTQVIDLGQAPASATHIWELVAGPNGKVYGGTYPNGALFEYDPAVGFTLLESPLVPGESYIKGVAYDAQTDQLYLGVGANAHIIKYDLATRTKENILPAAYSDQEFAYRFNISGRKLFVKLTPDYQMLVYDLDTGVLESEIPMAYAGFEVSPPSPLNSDLVYYIADGQFYTYDMSTAAYQATGVEIDLAANDLDFMQVNGQWQLVGNSADQMFTYNLVTGDVVITDLDLPLQDFQSRDVHAGPDGKVYTTGYQYHGVGIYDPATGRIVNQMKGIGQGEGMSHIGTDLYIGTYGKAKIYKYDTTSMQWPPEYLFSLSSYGQDRPYGMLGVESENKLFIGTAPNYGSLEGAFTAYDVSTATYAVHQNIVTNQSVVSLAYKDGEVYGGTSIWGGYGIDPTETEAKLFVYDVASGQKVYETVPVAGQKVISALTLGPDGNIWGMAGGTLFIFNPDTRQVIYASKKFTANYTSITHIDFDLVVGNDGNVYGTGRGKFFMLTGQSKTLTILSNDARYLTKDDAGHMYYASYSDPTKLIQYNSPTP